MAADMAQKLPMYQEVPQDPHRGNGTSRKPSRFAHPLGVTIAALSLLLMGLCYISLVSHPTGWGTTSASTTTSQDEQAIKAAAAHSESVISLTSLSPEAEQSASLNCKIGDLYGSCLNEIRFFQCTPDGPLTHPCPAGQRFFCTGEGTGQCAERHSDVGDGYEMFCHGRGELGACRAKAD